MEKRLQIRVKVDAKQIGDGNNSCYCFGQVIVVAAGSAAARVMAIDL